jgi:hypothetical protein
MKKAYWFSRPVITSYWMLLPKPLSRPRRNPAYWFQAFDVYPGCPVILPEKLKLPRGPDPSSGCQ